MNEWRQVTSRKDAGELNSTFGRFHDSCVREAHLWTAHFVNDELSMAVSGGLDSQLRIIVQRQFRDPASIELWFSEVVRFNWIPTADNYDSIIHSAEIRITERHEVEWMIDLLRPSSIPDLRAEVVVIAKHLQWRSFPSLGKKMVYNSGDYDA